MHRGGWHAAARARVSGGELHLGVAGVLGGVRVQPVVGAVVGVPQPEDGSVDVAHTSAHLRRHPAEVGGALATPEELVDVDAHRVEDDARVRVRIWG